MSNNRTLDQLEKAPKILERGVTFQGHLNGMDNYIVHGTVVGDSDVHGALMLGPQSHWKGNVVADVVVLRGAVEGNVTARVKLEVRDTAKIAGNLESPLIAIAAGARIQGQLAQDSCITRFVERRNR